MIRKSQNTLIPIEYVPYIIIYINGSPMKYTGELSVESLVYCMMDITKYVDKLQAKYRQVTDQQGQGQRQEQGQGQGQGQRQEQQTKGSVKMSGGVHEYAIGIPKNISEKVCYLKYSDAYKNNIPSGQNQRR
jgi:hypothetical protein